MAEIQHIQPHGLFPPTGYTHVVTGSGTRNIFVSGQVGVNADGEIANDLEAQVDQTFENLRIALEAAGATFDDVVKLSIFVVDYEPSMRPTIQAARSRYVDIERPPAATLVGVTALAVQGLLIEVEATAVVD